ncbi:MAG: hypothetical protein OXB86_01610 [Bdellovibrionales bacterium]|nr:hypothetical protein [Bdellovibrionales bacterium]
MKPERKMKGYYKNFIELKDVNRGYMSFKYKKLKNILGFIVNEGFGASGFMKGFFKNSFFIFCFSGALFLNASCRPLKELDHGLKDPFSERRAKTLYDKNQFVIKIPVAATVNQEEDSSSSDLSTENSTGIKEVDWIKAPLTEEYLKKLGAIRIKTVSEGERVKNSIIQAGTFIDSNSDISFINQYYKLDYNLLDFPNLHKTDLKEVKKDNPQKLWAFLLGKVDNFYGFPDTEYYILPHLEGNYLIFYRLGKPETIPYDQIPVSRRVGEFLATPLVGYPISYCVPENAEDDYGHTLDLIVPLCEGIAVKNAQYIDFLTKQKQLFQYEPKLDIFPENFFNGEWFYFRTVVEAGEKKANFIGHQPIEMANLVEFEKDENQFLVKDSTKYQELKEQDQIPNLFIPVKWKEYKMDRDGEAFNQFREVEDKDIKNVEKPYFTLNFKQFADIERENYSSSQLTVDRVLITDDSFHFDINIARKGSAPIIIKYSFKKVVDNPDYPQKRWYEEDSKTFHPVFSVERKYYPKTTDITQEDRDKFIRASRFDPNQKEIRWYFSTNTPKDEWIRHFGRLAVELENKAFQEAGKYSNRKIKLVLDESEDKELGDIRYNILNLVATKTIAQEGRLLFGYGPNVSNPITGEVVSATANVWVSYIVDSYIGIVRRYIRFHVWPLPWKILPSSPGVSDFLHEKIQKHCPEVTQFISQYKGTIPPLHPIHSDGVLNDVKDKEVQMQCVRKLARVRILRTTVHEMRHGLGFRHVFSASADVENYYENYDEIREIYGEPVWLDNTPILDEEVTNSNKKPAYYSSVMDYVQSSFPIIHVPGKYDIAATRYLYFDQLETIDRNAVNGVVTLNSGDKSILQEVKEGPVPFTGLNSDKSLLRKIDHNQLKKYHVCGGTKTSDTTDDPFCTTFDYGRTPKEILQNIIRTITDHLMFFSRRYDTYRNPSLRVTLTGVNKFLKNWLMEHRKIFHNIGQNIDHYHLNEESIAEYEKTIQLITKENPAFKKLQDMIPLLVDFFKKFSRLPSKTCIYQQEDKSYKAVSLEVVHIKIKSLYPENSRAVLVDCQSDVVKQWAVEQNMGKFLTEVGVWRHGVEYFVHPRAEEDLYSEAPASISVLSALRTVVPLIVYIPGLFEDIFKGVKDSILNGVDLNPYIDKAALREKMNLPKDAPLEVPRLLNYEMLVSTQKTPMWSYMVLMKMALSSILKMNKSPEVKRKLHFKYNLLAFNPINVQNDVSDLNLRRFSAKQAKERMMRIYQAKAPFIYKAYEDYIELYSTDNQVPSKPPLFVDFLKTHPSVAHFGKYKKWVVPLDEDNVFVDILKQYNEYKTCIESSPDTCEQLEEKRAFMELVEGTVNFWMAAG